ncbi:hypothetical protein RA28_08155 [Ruegeria sp. ANG-S4]|uniref:hypothetical protein n=1 Tax=Ruegeria sp. ANG-S4 TaxID=1577904 RepID=UPI00057CA86E|nr:hypothetical protein [Ruegeria sp. ANG-S4]KIC45677.1 hypothetical protein RA28_08155 [Ruegeria sp. ANG-S4]
MAGRSYSTRLIAAAISASLALTACGGSNDTTAPQAASGGTTQAEADLAKQAAALQKTILQGAIAGGVTGGAIGFGLGGDDDIGSGISIGLGAGALAGTYVAFVQRKYAGREARLRQIKSDLDRNAAEMQTTLNVMNQVLAAQKAELDALNARAAAGTVDQAELQRELAEANGNLSQMELAIGGATKRQAEFAEARNLTIARGQSASPIDGDLSALSNQISQMRGIASDLASSL